ncbi:leucine-rich repeat-containing protein 57-like isoform X2 [Leptotrombidium deliense]|uniref:Leucine-rich repeat-containing protein 57-like isoform X2 n=1 Tax=Leptotrombidium deliense TaxID=299467 RepID=A0A443SDR8_9ACAR|nr:leucine-rich repeat-containing protein 57-like isoform X2 [Leptotrombidium deliense]
MLNELLTKANLNEFPKDIVRLKSNIRSVDLSVNKLRSVPAFVGQFSCLRHLSLNNNRINEIAPEIGTLSKLETLSLNSNQLVSLPSSISQLKNLRNVSLSDNKLRSFPTVFCDLTHLDFLDLSRNNISEVPDGVKSLHVSELNLNQNQVSVLSEELARCPRLKILRLEENCIQLNVFPTKILTDSQVSVLTIDGNLFEMKAFHNLQGYEQYMERYTATKKKIT